MEIKLDKYTLRFDPSEIRISIDGEKIDVGARTKQVLPELNDVEWVGPGLLTLNKKKLYNKDIAQHFLPIKKDGKRTKKKR